MEHLFTDFDSNGIRNDFGIQDGKLVVRSRADVQPALDRNARMRNDSDYKKAGIKANFMHAAHIPDIIIMKWLKDHGFNAMTAHPTEVARFIESRPEYHYLKVVSGRIA